MPNVKKCGYSSKYYPLLMGIYSQDTTFDKSVFRKFLDDHFIEEDAKKVFDNFMRGLSQESPQTPSYEIQKIDGRNGKEIANTNDNIISRHKLTNSQYNKIRNGFEKAIISGSIYNMNSNEFIDANEMIGDTTKLNKFIFEYRKALLEIVANYISKPLSENFDNLSTKELIEEFNSKLDEFSTYKSDQNNGSRYNEAFDAYVTLKSFDELLNKHTPFIGIDPKYTDSSVYSKDRYIYLGPNVQHFTGFSTSEFADAESVSSDLAKILLNYFPEVDKNGNILENTSISLSGFYSTMNRFKQWEQNSSIEEVINERKKDVERDINKLLGLYIDELSNVKNINPEHKTFLINKLRGIQRFIYNPNMHQMVKNMFTNMMDKTVLSDYITYSNINTDSTLNLGSINLTERPIRLQSDDIKFISQAAAEYWKKYKSGFNKLIQKYGVVIGKDNIIIGNARIEKLSNGTTKLIGEIPNFEALLNEITTLNIDDSFNQVVDQVYSDRNHSAMSLYAPILSNVLWNIAYPTNSNEQAYSPSWGELKDLGRILSIINGSDLLNVIKNAEGNNLPLWQMICLAYQHNKVANEITNQLNNNPEIESPYIDNVIYQNIDKIKKPRIRTDIILGKNNKSSSDQSEHEVLSTAIGQEFFKNLMNAQSQDDDNKQEALIGLQVHTYSDKNKHFIMMFDLKENWKFGNKGINFKQVLDNYFKTGNVEDMKPITDIWFESSQKQVNSTLTNLFNDYSKVFGKEFNSIEDVKQTLSNYDGKTIRNLFSNAGVEFVEELHGSNAKGKYIFNETLENLSNIFSNRDNFKSFLNEQFNQFLTWSNTAWNYISKDDGIKTWFNTYAPEFVNNRELLKYDKKGRINPILYSYFIMDSFLTNEYNKLMIGEVYAHPNKNKESIDAEGYLGHSFASRWIAQVKRMVIYGATYHSYAQGMKYGVPKNIKMAVMPDIPANVWNLTGLKSKVDSSDGAGLTSPLFSRMQNVSLIDAAVSGDKKTIYHDINAKYGFPKTLKWAEYEITNEARRSAQTTNLEQLFRKMHNLQFTKAINFQQDFDNLYFRGSQTGDYYKINSVQVVNGILTRTLTKVDKNGVPSETFQEASKQITTVYDIDQMFGGAWAMAYNELTKNLQYTESNLDLTTKLVCDEDLKDYMIGWLVNKSAIKVGAMNINELETWNDDSNLRYTIMSTQFGGVQMNADHELDDADVTEPSQMISGLEQNGYTHRLATAAYEEIGKACYDGIKDIIGAINNNDKEKLYQIFGKAVVQSFASGTKDTLGLAQSFVKLAQKSLEEGNFKYKIPFSSPSINGIFNSTVTSSLVKKAIRRHYAGIASVLHPSFNMMEFYSLGGLNYRYEELIDYVKERTKGTQFEGIPLQEFISKEIINGERNPFTELIAIDNPIDFEDTIIFNNNGVLTSDKIDSIEKYDKYKALFAKQIENGLTPEIYRWTIKPRNLQGSNTKFIVNGENVSILDSDESVALRLLSGINWKQRNDVKYKNLTDTQFIYRQLEELCKEAYGEDTFTYFVSVLGRALKLSEEGEIDRQNARQINIKHEQKQLKLRLQKLLNNLGDGKPIIWRGKTVIASDVVVKPAQIIMGKLYAKQLGLLPGDSLAEIKQKKEAFFKERLLGYYNIDNPNHLTYDWVLFDGTGKKLYVKLRTKNVLDLFHNSGADSNYQNVNGDIYLDDKKVCSAKRKEFLVYTDNDGNNHDIVVVDTLDDFRELKKSGLFLITQRNYRPDNYNFLVKEEFGEGVSIQLMHINEHNKYVPDNIAKFENTQRLLAALAENQDYELERKLDRLAKTKYESFEKSLRFIGTRIPCQSMQSFAPMEIIAFTDDEINRVYTASSIQFLEGSDFD